MHNETVKAQHPGCMNRIDRRNIQILSKALQPDSYVARTERYGVNRKASEAKAYRLAY